MKSYEYPFIGSQNLTFAQTETEILRLSLRAANGTKTDDLSRKIYS